MNSAHDATHNQNSRSLWGWIVSWSAFVLSRLKKRVFAAETSMMSRYAA